MASDEIQSPEVGGSIVVSENGILTVPNNPIVAYVDAGETKLWQATSAVIDAVVEKSYSGEKNLVWKVSEEGCVADVSPLGLNLAGDSSVLSVLLSGALLLRDLDWFEASDLLQETISEVLQTGMTPEGTVLVSQQEKVTAQVFCDAVLEHMDDEAIFDVDAEQYDALAKKFSEEFESATENTVEIAKKAMEKARRKLTEAGQFTEEKGEKLKEFLENDFSRVAQGMKKGAKEKLNPSRLGVGALSSMSKLLHKTGVALSSFADKADASLACKSGEITSAGKLVCNNCGNVMNFKKTGRIPPCPKCHKTEFTKGY